MFLVVRKLFATTLAALVKLNDDFELEVVRDDFNLAEQYGVYFSKPDSSSSLNYIRLKISQLRELADQVPVENVSRIPTPPQYDDSYKIGISNIEKGLEAYVRKVGAQAYELQREYVVEMSSVCSEKRDFNKQRSGYISRRSILRPSSKHVDSNLDDEWESWGRSNRSSSPFYVEPKPFSSAGSLADRFTAEAVYQYLEANLFELLNHKLVMEPVDYTPPTIRYRRTLFVPFRKTRFAGFIRKTLDKLPV